MALVDASARARAFRVVVGLVIASTVVGLCQLVLVPESDTQISQRGVGPAVGIRTRGSEIPGVDENSGRSTDDVDMHPPVRSVAPNDHVVTPAEASEGSKQESFEYESEDDGEAQAEEGPSWRSFAVEERRGIGNRVKVTRGRSLRTSKQPHYPCNLPPGTCQATQTCCGSACVTVTSNGNHCGRCGHICSVKRACCGGKCRRLATDEKNCGRCGSRCESGTKCLFGLCGYSS